jgi:hypothetical protein
MLVVHNQLNSQLLNSIGFQDFIKGDIHSVAVLSSLTGSTSLTGGIPASQQQLQVFEYHLSILSFICKSVYSYELQICNRGYLL